MFSVRSLTLLAIVGCAWATQYNNGYNNHEQAANQYNGAYKAYAPKVAILNHKQALGSDGSFNYAFNAENGIQQGESIGPDGSRHGSYSYVDPNGKTVHLKYVAGRDGFRVVEGEHLPRQVPLPAHHAAAYQAAAAAHADAAHHSAPTYHAAAAEQPAHYQTYQSNDDDGSYKPSADEGQYRHGAYNAAAEEIHSGPHSFGNGFAFEFGGHKY